MAKTMQLLISLTHGVGDPCAVGIAARTRTGIDDAAKGLVITDSEGLAPQHFAETAGNMQLVREQYEAWIGRPPEDRLALLIPRITAMPVSRENAFRP